MLRLHPALTHFPIGFFASASLVAIGNVLDVFDFTEVVTVLLVAGLASSTLTVATGFWEFWKLGESGDKELERTLWLHMGIVATALTVYLAALFVHFGGSEFFSLILMIVGFAVLTLGSHFGGILVYRFGVGVGRKTVEE